LQAGAGPPGDVHVVRVVGQQQLASALVVDQRERGEVRQVHAVVVDQVGLQAAVRDHRTPVELRQRCHVFSF
jgi:hypothetical protein